MDSVNVLTPGGSDGSPFIGFRPPDPAPEPFDATEGEWSHPTFRMWQAHSRTRSPIADPYGYSVGGLMSGGLDVPVPATAPSLFQHARQGFEGPMTHGARERCFEWHVPDPPRPLCCGSWHGVMSYWGFPEDEAITLGPGEEASFTQYYVAYIDYPLSVSVDRPAQEPCTGGTTRVAVSGSGALIAPAARPIRYLWTSTDPRVAFDDPSSADTFATVEGTGTFPVVLHAAIGAYDAQAETSIEVVDLDPPVIDRLAIDPPILWPPDHRLVDVHVEAQATDGCDPAPVVRLVAVSSDEDDDANGVGDGHTTGDIRGADLDTDDLALQLRAERQGVGDGRTYTLTYEAEDASGNVATRMVTVSVPHDMGGASRRSLRAAPRHRP